MQKFRKWIYSLCILTGLLAVCTACGKADSQPKEETTEVVTDGPVSGPEDFKRLGMIIDVASSNMRLTARYRDLLSDQLIHQCGFTYIWSSYDRNKS